MPKQFLQALLAVVSGLFLGCLLLAWWFTIAIWNVVIFFTIGLFFPMFRAFRRGDRKRKLEAIQHRETLRALQHGDLDITNLKSERVIIQSPMSFRGAYLRIMKLAQSASPK